MRRSKENRQVIISISGCYGENNIGDDILFMALVRGIRARLHDCTIVAFTANRKNTERLLVREGIEPESVRTVYSGRWGLFEPESPPLLSILWIFQTFRWIHRSDLLLIGPGNPIKDDTNRFKLLFYLSRAVIAYLLKTPYAYIGVGVGNVTWRVSRCFFKIFGNRAVFISARDLVSAEKLSELGIDGPKVISLADLSFCETILPSFPENERTMAPSIIGLSARHFSYKHFPENIIKNYYDSLISWCKWINSTYGCKFIFFPFCEEEHQSDFPAYDKLSSKLEPHSIRIEIYRCQNFSELKSQIAQCDLFLGTRFHSVLLATQQNVPVLAISYEEKAYKFMKEVGLEEYVIQIEELSFELLKHKWEQLYRNRESIQQNLNIIKQQQADLASRYFDLIVQAVEKKIHGASVSW
ncbi:MAG: polysaccharide pyruvyl transferase family protein [Gemmatimonadota bacterium]|nr:MAG: polysaccharide pyruvyl transferase family protein [Gemmatimonadota bacterium]